LELGSDLAGDKKKKEKKRMEKTRRERRKIDAERKSELSHAQKSFWPMFAVKINREYDETRKRNSVGENQTGKGGEALAARRALNKKPGKQ